MATGFARGFCGLSPEVEIQYKCTAVYNGTGESGILWNDPEIWREAALRGGDAPLAWRRIYVFDYTEDGFARKRGFVVLTGDDIDTVGLGPRAA
mgnify:CR=1 FL=1